MNYWSSYHNRETRYLMCDICGSRMLRKKDVFGSWDGETYYCPKCYSDEDDFNDIEEGCRACGNPAYPKCKSSCNLFDD